MTDEDDSGIGNTPTFLFIVQFVMTFVMVGLCILGELHKPSSIMMCFPLLMSRTGRGAIILAVSGPITNFGDFFTALISIIGISVGILNISLGCNDAPVELRFADDGVPEWAPPVKASTAKETPAKMEYGMQALPQ